MADQAHSIRDGHCRTNPAWVLEQSWDDRDANACRERLAERVARWHDEGIFMPECVIEELVRTGVLPGSDEHHGHPATRIIGLVVDRDHPDTGFVNPIQVVTDSRWQVAHNLPFQLGHIQDGLAAVLKCSGSSGAIPELFSCRIKDPLEIRSEGSSMDIAALLAVIDAIGGTGSPLFRRACATIDPVERLDQDSNFRKVGGVKTKLKAFEREYGNTGSLLVRLSTDEEASQFDDLFEDVWPIDNFEQLVKKLTENHLIEPLLDEGPSKLDIDTVRSRWQWLETQELKHAALEFTERCLQWTSQQEAVPLTVQLEIESKIEALQRDLGQYVNAFESSKRAVERLEGLGDLVDDESIIRFQVSQAAAFYDAHLFQDEYELLEPVANRIRKDKRRISIAVRCELFNTLAETMVVLDKDGWEDLFRESIDAQQQVERHLVPRTRNCLIHALLKHGRVEDAQCELDLAKQWELDPFDQYSQTFLWFYEAEHARQRGLLWSTTPDDGEVGLPNTYPRHAVGFYLQATARQPNRSPDDVIRRFDAAVEALQDDCQGDPPGNILPVLVQFVRLASSATKQDTTAWCDARQEVDRLLSDPAADGIRQFYGDVLAACGDTPDPEQVEAVLARVPYF